MIARIWSGESPLWRLLLPLSWLYGLVSGAIRLSYKLGFKRAYMCVAEKYFDDICYPQEAAQ
ncbi:DUF5448 family protein [Salmonella enterica subsp. enterica serovar Montevideo]